MAQRIDWPRIEALYVAGNMSLRELAAQEKVSFSTLSGVSAKNSWSEKRRQFRDKVKEKSLARAQARGVEQLEKLINAAERTTELAVQALEDNEQFRRYIVTEGSGEGCSEVSEKVFRKADTKAIKDMAAALRDLTGLVRDFYGIRTPAEEVREKIAREKLKLEKKRTDAALQASTEDRGGPVEVSFVNTEGSEE